MVSQQNLHTDALYVAKRNVCVLKILYVFSGKSCKGAVSHWCKTLAKRLSIAVEVEMIDIKVKPHLDLTKESVRQKLLHRLQVESFHAAIFSPTLFNLQQSALVKQKRSEGCAVIRSSEGSATFDMAGA